MIILSMLMRRARPCFLLDCGVGGIRGGRGKGTWKGLSGGRRQRRKFHGPWEGKGGSLKATEAASDLDRGPPAAVTNQTTSRGASCRCHQPNLLPVCVPLSQLDPCYPPGWVQDDGTLGHGNFSLCREVAVALLEAQGCAKGRARCIGGVDVPAWGGPILAIENFHYTAEMLGLSEDATVQDFVNAGACSYY